MTLYGVAQWCRYNADIQTVTVFYLWTYVKVSLKVRVSEFLFHVMLREKLPPFTRTRTYPDSHARIHRLKQVYYLPDTVSTSIHLWTLPTVNSSFWEIHLSPRAPLYSRGKPRVVEGRGGGRIKAPAQYSVLARVRWFGVFDFSFVSEWNIQIAS